MKAYFFVFLFLFEACSPSGPGGGTRNFTKKGSLTSVSSSVCGASGGEWTGESCEFEIPLVEAQNSDECTVSGGTWSERKGICVTEVSMGATIAGVKTREECLTRDGYWIGDLCYVNEEDMTVYNPFHYSYTEEECLEKMGVWTDDYCTLPGDVSYESLLQDNNPCDFNSDTYNEYACQMTSQSRCEASFGVWDTGSSTCNCDDPMTWSTTYLACGYYEQIDVKYNDEVALEIFNPTEHDFFPIYVIEKGNDWAAYDSWVLRNDVFGTLVSSWEGGSEGLSLVEDTNGADSNSDEGKVGEKKCYMRFKIKNAENPESTDIIKNGDLIKLEAVGLCEDEEHCDIYFNRETSVSIAASVGIGVGIGIAAVGVLAATVATGGAIVGAVAGAGAAAVAAGTGAASVAVATSVAGTAGAAAATSSVVGAATAAAAAGTSTAAAVTTAAAAASSVGAAAGAGASLGTAGFIATSVLAGTGAAIGSGVAAASIDWGHMMAYDEYIESDINLEWSEFTGSDAFKLEIYEEGEDTLTVGSDPNGGSLSFYLTSTNTVHEDRDGFYVKTDDEVVMTERTENEDGTAKMASEFNTGEAQEGGPSRIRIQLCGSFCKALEAGLTCWDD